MLTKEPTDDFIRRGCGNVPLPHNMHAAPAVSFPGRIGRSRGPGQVALNPNRVSVPLIAETGSRPNSLPQHKAVARF